MTTAGTATPEAGEGEFPKASRGRRGRPRGELTTGEAHCRRCGVYYSGKTFHCGLCCALFVSIVGFDAHEPSPRGCKDPARLKWPALNKAGEPHRYAGLPMLQLTTRKFRGAPYQAWTVAIYGEEQG